MSLDNAKIVDVKEPIEPAALEVEANRYLKERPQGIFVVRTSDSLGAARINNFLMPRHLPFNFKEIRPEDGFSAVRYGIICYQEAA